jgi:hypothetical protein
MTPEPDDDDETPSEGPKATPDPMGRDADGLWPSERPPGAPFGSLTSAELKAEAERRAAAAEPTQA